MERRVIHKHILKQVADNINVKIQGSGKEALEHAHRRIEEKENRVLELLSNSFKRFGNNIENTIARLTKVQGTNKKITEIVTKITEGSEELKREFGEAGGRYVRVLKYHTRRHARISR